MLNEQWFEDAEKLAESIPDPKVRADLLRQLVKIKETMESVQKEGTRIINAANDLLGHPKDGTKEGDLLGTVEEVRDYDLTKNHPLPPSGE
jgi:hypothetical protein